MLAGAGIDKIFTSTARRTMETGAIIAKALDVETEALSPGDTTALLDMIGFDHEDGRVLIVGHNETIPAILAELGMSDPVQMSDTNFGRLFVVVPGTDGLTVIDMSMP